MTDPLAGFHADNLKLRPSQRVTTSRTARILRYEVPVDDQWHTLTLAGPIVHIATRDPRVVEVWATDDGFGSQELDLIVVGTGQPYPAGGEVCHRGTAIAPGGGLVWHLMQRGPGRLVPTKEQP